MADIFELSDRAVDLICDADPMLATEVGVAGRDHRWPDLSPAGHDERAALATSLLEQATATAATTPAEQLARRVLIEDLEGQLARYRNGAHLRDMNNIASPFQSIRQTFDLMPKGTKDEWMRLIVRLETIGDPLAGYMACLTAGIDAGSVVAERQVRAVITEGTITGGRPTPLLEIVDSYDASSVGDDGMRERLMAAVETARAAYAAFTEWLADHYLAHASDTDGIGSEHYLVELRQYLGMTIDLDATYQWGWQEVERLQHRLAALCESLSPGAGVAETISELDTDPGGAAATPSEFISAMAAVQEQALASLADTHFDVPEPIRSINVSAAPPGGALAPYYTGPSEDFSRSGTVWYPLGDRTSFPLWGEITTAYHEGFPGHHLQVGIQVALGETLSRYHRVMVWQPGAGEGWALYAENLMSELGYLERPEYEIGFLIAQLMRACRVVIDIGAHCHFAIPDEVDFHPGEGWTFETAVEMMRDIALQPQDMAVSEITRYFGWPGQAISYKVGEKVILDLRNELALRPDFDLKAFHTKVLEVGSIGLDLLKELVRDA